MRGSKHEHLGSAIGYNIDDTLVSILAISYIMKTVNILAFSY